MTAQLPTTENTPMVLKFHPVITMTDDQLFDFCQLNKDFRIERNLIASLCQHDSCAFVNIYRRINYA